MTDAPTPSLWARLRADRPLYDDTLLTECAGTIPDGREVLYGIDRRADLHLLIPIDDGEGDKPADLQGLRVRHQIIDADRHYLDLVASAAHERCFSPLVSEILEAVIEHRREPVKAVNAIIRAWQSAWKPVVLGMSKTVQVGAFGELLTLEKIMIPALGPEAVFLWSGPEYERHDFVGKTLHVEVKATRKSRHEHDISRIDQLDVPAGRKLIFVSVLLEESVAGTDSVATKMDTVIDLIRSDSAASDVFMAKMAQIGWSDELRRSGELLRFHLRGAQIYEVNDAFPRLPVGLSCPEGVVSIRYTVDLANIPSIGLDDVIEMVRDDTKRCK